MTSEDTKILEFDQYQKSDKALFIVYADLECIKIKIDERRNNPENSSTTKLSKHIPLGFSMSTISSFRAHSLVVSNFRSKTKGSWFESGCYLCTEVSSLQ